MLLGLRSRLNFPDFSFSNMGYSIFIFYPGSDQGKV